MYKIKTDDINKDRVRKISPLNKQTEALVWRGRDEMMFMCSNHNDMYTMHITTHYVNVEQLSAF